MIYKSIGSCVVSWFYDQQLEGKYKWFPIGEVSGFVWMVVIDIIVTLFFVALAIWLFI